MKFITILLFSILAFDLRSQNDLAQEKQEIRSVLNDYLIGTSQGQPARLRRAFHPDFKLYTVSDNQLVIRSGETYIQNIEEGQIVNRIGEIISIDVNDYTATAKVLVSIPGYRVFTDYFLLLKYEDSWKIVQKSYSSRTFGESDNLSLANPLDTLFAEVDRPDHPAVAVVAIKDGAIVYQKAFGSAHLDHQIPATSTTKFQLAGLSKHFTAFAALLLEDDGLLSREDDIRKYLPELPAYPQTITIGHLLSMSSGLPDIWTLKEIAGWHADDVFTQEDALKILQKVEPGFVPGSDFLHSNTDILLLSEIISKVAQQPFSQVMKTRIFDPLEMTNTLVVDDFEGFIPNLALSYEPDGDAFKRSALNIGAYGATNVYSTIEDLAKWELNLLKPTLGTQEIIEKLFAECITNDGSTMDSGYGRFSFAQQYYHWGHGVREIYQIGTLGGYSSSIFKFPDQDFTVITLSSGMPYSGYLGMRLTDHYIGETFDEATIDFSQLKTRKVSDKKLQSYTGTYWSEQVLFSRDITLQNDTLRYVRSDGRASALLPIGPDTFQMMVPWNEKVIVSFNDPNVMRFQSDDAPPLLFEKTKKHTHSQAELEGLTGRYFCEALDAVYHLVLEEGALVAKNLRTGEVRLSPIKEDVFQGDQPFFAGVYFDRDRKGFVLRTEDIRTLKFEKLSE